MKATRPLTALQAQFVREWIKDRRGTDAYRRALKTLHRHPVTSQTAKVNAAKTLALANVQAEINRITAPILEKQEVTDQTFLDELAAIALHRVSRLMVVQPDGTFTMDMTRATDAELTALTEPALDETETTDPETGVVTVKRQWKLKSHNKLDALKAILAIRGVGAAKDGPERELVQVVFINHPRAPNREMLDVTPTPMPLPGPAVPKR